MKLILLTLLAILPLSTLGTYNKELEAYISKKSIEIESVEVGKNCANNELGVVLSFQDFLRSFVDKVIWNECMRADSKDFQELIRKSDKKWKQVKLCGTWQNQEQALKLKLGIQADKDLFLKQKLFWDADIYWEDPKKCPIDSWKPKLDETKKQRIELEEEYKFMWEQEEIALWLDTSKLYNQAETTNDNWIKTTRQYFFDFLWTVVSFSDFVYYDVLDSVSFTNSSAEDARSESTKDTALEPMEWRDMWSLYNDEAEKKYYKELVDYNMRLVGDYELIVWLSAESSDLIDNELSYLSASIIKANWTKEELETLAGLGHDDGVSKEEIVNNTLSLRRFIELVWCRLSREHNLYEDRQPDFEYNDYECN